MTEQKPPAELVHEGEVLSSSRPIGQTARIAQVVQKAEFYSGPLPRPADLDQYNKILPGLAERVVALTEREQAHRHEIEKLAIGGTIQAETRDSTERRIGQFAALLIALTGLGIALWLGINDKQAVASVIGGTTLISIVVAFLKPGQSRMNGARPSPSPAKQPQKPQQNRQTKRRK